MTTRERRTRRWRIVKALVLGVALNVLVAWVCVLTVGGYKPVELIEPDVFHQSSETGQTFYVPWPGGTPSSWPDVAASATRSNGFGWRSERYTSDDFLSSQIPDTEYMHNTYHAGWPMHALHATMVLERDLTGSQSYTTPWILQKYGDRPATLYRMGYPVHRLPDVMIRTGANSDAWWARSHRSFGYRRIPLVPMPLGFVVNTALYTLLAWCALTLLALWRMKRRVRKGLCHVCRYKRDGLDGETPCPECGAVVPAERPIEPLAGA